MPRMTSGAFAQAELIARSRQHRPLRGREQAHGLQDEKRASNRCWEFIMRRRYEPRLRLSIVAGAVTAASAPRWYRCERADQRHLGGVVRRPIPSEDVVKPHWRISGVLVVPRVPWINRLRLACDEPPVVRADMPPLQKR